MRALRYLPAYSIPLVVFITMSMGGWYVWVPVLYVFGIIPLGELIVGRNPENMDREAEDRAKKSPIYTLILWGFIPVQFALIFYFGYLYTTTTIPAAELAGIAISIALSNGGIGITIAHELVHRSSRFEQILGRILLTSVMYMHFAIEHVRGHHALVATQDDPATARFGQSYYAFLFPSIIGQWLSAWKLESERLKKKKHPVYSMHNEMIWFVFWQILFCLILLLIFGWVFTGIFLGTAFVSFSLLEAVNYIEHYGLERKKNRGGRYEKVTHHHSWNSDHILSRMFLFELTRHSDHHAVASRKYQVLRSFDASPQLPTGYPGMIVVALIPPLWFHVMDPLVEKAAPSAP